MSKLEQVIDHHARALMAIPGVVDVHGGLCARGMQCIKVKIVANAGPALPELPRRIEGFRVEISEAGHIRYYRREDSRTP